MCAAIRQSVIVDDEMSEAIVVRIVFWCFVKMYLRNL
jgi:hypothetical protein